MKRYLYMLGATLAASFSIACGNQHQAPRNVPPAPAIEAVREAAPARADTPAAPTPEPPAYTETFETLHAGRLESLRLVHGLGDRRDPNVLLPYANTVDDGGAEPWQLDIRGHAMLLVRPERGHVVVTARRDPFDFAFSTLPTRELDDFEREALQRLMAGEDLVVERRYGDVRMLGAVRAEPLCLSCHQETQAGRLMAAFTYRFEEMPDD